MGDSLKNRFEIQAAQHARATDYKDRSASREAVQDPW
jgi:plasmid stability protein